MFVVHLILVILYVHLSVVLYFIMHMNIT